MHNPSFLGRGWAFPVSFTNDGKEVLVSSGASNIEETIEILLTTEVAERLMHPNFGCELHKFIYEELSEGLVSRIKAKIADAILMHEPRITIIDIRITKDQNNSNMLLITLEYLIRATNTRSNKVYPFYLNEANENG